MIDTSSRRQSVACPARDASVLKDKAAKPTEASSLAGDKTKPSQTYHRADSRAADYTLPWGARSNVG